MAKAPMTTGMPGVLTRQSHRRSIAPAAAPTTKAIRGAITQLLQNTPLSSNFTGSPYRATSWAGGNLMKSIGKRAQGAKRITRKTDSDISTTAITLHASTVRTALIFIGLNPRVTADSGG
jgi:hypothetical protein